MSNALNLREINQEQCADLLEFYIRTNHNILLVGQRGIGKTLLSFQAAQKCGLKVAYINLSTLERTDLLGFPNLFEKGDIIHFKSPYYLPFLEKGQKPNQVIIFDEVDKANTDIQAPLLEILQFKTINGKPLNAAACVLTGNLPQENVFSNSISTALLDRCAKYVLTFDFQRWNEWAQSNGIHDLVLGFLTANQEMSCGKLEDTTYASCSPRGWTDVSQSLINANKFKITDLNTITNIVAGFVGQEAALKFEAWLKFSRSFEQYIHSFLEDGVVNFDYKQLSPTEKLVFCITTCYLAKTKILSANSMKKKNRYLNYLCKFMVEYQVPPELQLASLGNSFNDDLIIKHKLFEHKLFFKLIENLQR